jgi:predicted transcriptional regulator YdeE
VKIERCTKSVFSVIGKEGSTNDGEGFIDRLWNDANSHFHEVAALAKKDSNGNLLGIWGLMSDLSREFRPWEDGFTKGLYLAGVEVHDESLAPQGWIKWTVPAFEYLYVAVGNDRIQDFHTVLDYIKDNNMELASAVHDFMCPEENGKPYMFFPIRKL